MEREIESLRKRLDFLERQKRNEEEKERKKETIEYNLKIIQDVATNMKERGQEARIMKYHPEYGMVCRACAPAFEAIYNSLRLINEQLNPPKTNEINTNTFRL
jgi:predicted HNH restriction endonuclease